MKYDGEIYSAVINVFEIFLTFGLLGSEAMKVQGDSFCALILVNLML